MRVMECALLNATGAILQRADTLTLSPGSCGFISAVTPARLRELYIIPVVYPLISNSLHFACQRAATVANTVMAGSPRR